MLVEGVLLQVFAQDLSPHVRECVLQQSEGVLQQSECVLQQSECVLQQSEGVLQQSECVLQQFECVLQQTALRIPPKSAPYSFSIGRFSRVLTTFEIV